MNQPVPVNELSDGSELVRGELEMIARYQQNLLEKYLRAFTPAEQGSVLLWRRSLQELEVVPK